MGEVVELRQASFSGKSDGPGPPRKPKNRARRARELLTEREVGALMRTARRHGHRDRTMILVAYRHRVRVRVSVSQRV